MTTPDNAETFVYPIFESLLEYHPEMFGKTEKHVTRLRENEKVVVHINYSIVLMAFFLYLGDRYEKNLKRISDEAKRISDEAKRISDEAKRISDEAKRISDKAKDENRYLVEFRKVTIRELKKGAIYGGFIKNFLVVLLAELKSLQMKLVSKKDSEKIAQGEGRSADTVTNEDNALQKEIPVINQNNKVNSDPNTNKDSRDVGETNNKQQIPRSPTPCIFRWFRRVSETLSVNGLGSKPSTALPIEANKALIEANNDKNPDQKILNNKKLHLLNQNSAYKAPNNFSSSSNEQARINFNEMIEDSGRFYTFKKIVLAFLYTTKNELVAASSDAAPNHRPEADCVTVVGWFLEECKAEEKAFYFFPNSLLKRSSAVSVLNGDIVIGRQLSLAFVLQEFLFLQDKFFHQIDGQGQRKQNQISNRNNYATFQAQRKWFVTMRHKLSRDLMLFQFSKLDPAYRTFFENQGNTSEKISDEFKKGSDNLEKSQEIDCKLIIDEFKKGSDNLEKSQEIDCKLIIERIDSYLRHGTGQILSILERNAKWNNRIDLVGYSFVIFFLSTESIETFIKLSLKWYGYTEDQMNGLGWPSKIELLVGVFAVGGYLLLKFRALQTKGAESDLGEDAAT
jgi:hypothetical protein